MKRIVAFLVFITLGCSVDAASKPGAQSITRTAKVTSVLTLPKDSTLISVPVFTNDGSSAAAVYSRSKKKYGSINGKEMGPYDEIQGPFAFSKSPGFFGRRNGRWHLVADGGQDISCRDFMILRRSAHGSDIYWEAQSENENTPVLMRNRQVLAKGFRVEQAISSPDQRHVAISGFLDDAAVAFVDGVLVRLAENAKRHYFRDNQPYLTSQGKLGFIRHSFNEGTETIRFKAKTHASYRGTKQPLVSPDGEHIAYAARKGRDEGVVLVRDGKEDRPFREIGRPVFSPDSRTLAYPAQVLPQKGRKEAEVQEGEENPYVVVFQNKQGREYSKASDLTFSPDGSTLGYIATDKQRGQFIVLNEREGTPYQQVSNLVFSPDSKHYAYIANADSRWFVVVDGQEGRAFHWVEAPTFSPDSRQVSYGARGDITLQTDESGRPLAYPVSIEDGQAVLNLQVDGRGLTYQGHNKGEELWINSSAWIYTKGNEDELFWIKETIEPGAGASSGTGRPPGTPSTGNAATLVKKASDGEVMQLGLGFSHPGLSGQNEPFVMHTLFTLRKSVGNGQSGRKNDPQDGMYDMVIEKFDMTTDPIPFE